MKRNTNYVRTDLLLNGETGVVTISKRLTIQMGVSVDDVLEFTNLRGELFMYSRKSTAEDKHRLRPNAALKQGAEMSLKVYNPQLVNNILNNYAHKAHYARFRVGDFVTFGDINYFEVITRKNYAETHIAKGIELQQQ